MKFLFTNSVGICYLPIAPAFGFRNALSTYTHNVIAYSLSWAGDGRSELEGICISRFDGDIAHTTTNFRYKATAFK